MSKKLGCFYCDAEVSVDKDCKATLCSSCVSTLHTGRGEPPPTPVKTLTAEEKKAKKIAKEARKKAKAEAKPKGPSKGRGWHLKGYFVWEGKTYSFGKEVTGKDAERASAKYAGA